MLRLWLSEYQLVKRSNADDVVAEADSAAAAVCTARQAWLINMKQFAQDWKEKEKVIRECAQSEDGKDGTSDGFVL